MSEVKVLITGFEPFAGLAINPSWAAVSGLVDEHNLYKLELPVTYDTAFKKLRQAIKELKPDAVICCGLASRAGVNIERVATNIIDEPRADAQGRQIIDQPISSTGVPAYFSTLPIKFIVSAMREQGIPSKISNSADTMQCNTLFYRLMELLVAENSPILGGFIHVPLLPEQVVQAPETPAMSLSLTTQALSTAVEITRKIVLERRGLENDDLGLG